MDYMEDINANLYRYVIDFAYYSVGAIEIYAEYGYAGVERIRIWTNTYAITLTRDEEFCITLPDGRTGLSCEELDFVFDLKQRCGKLFAIADKALIKVDENAKTASDGKGVEA